MTKVLFFRSIPALGDILMHRMIFEDIKKSCPDCELHFAVKKDLIPAVIDHPYIDKVIDCDKVNYAEYLAVFNNNYCDTDYEEGIAPKSDKHRSDLYAENCGFELTNHNMHIRISDEEKEEAKSIIKKYQHKSGKIILIAPMSHRSPMRQLLPHQIKWIAEELSGACPIALHSSDIPDIGIPVISDLSIRQLMAVVSIASGVVSIDTGIFHLAGGLGIPLCGIFTNASGKVYGKYYDCSIVQHCPNPCYSWHKCCHGGEIKPCLTEITREEIKAGIKCLLNLQTN